MSRPVEFLIDFTLSDKITSKKKTLQCKDFLHVVIKVNETNLSLKGGQVTSV